MPQPFRTGTLQLARIDPSAIERAGAAMGQAYQQLGNIAATTLEKYRKRKEEKAKVDNIRERIMQNPEAHGVQNEEEAGVLAKAYNESPEFMQFEMQAKAAQREQTRLALLEEEARYRKSLRPINEQLTKTQLEQAKGQLSDLEFQRQQRMDEQSARDLVPYVGQLPSGQIGLDPATSEGIPSGIVARAVEMKKAEMAAQEKARLDALKTTTDIAGTNSLINYRTALGEAAKTNAVAAKIKALTEGTGIGDKVKDITDQIDKMSEVRHEVKPGVWFTLKELMGTKDGQEILRTSRRLPETLKRQLRTYKALNEDLSNIQLNNTQTVTFTDKEGNVVKANITLAEILQREAEQEELAEAEGEAQKAEKRKQLEAKRLRDLEELRQLGL
jgi:hypothetical protein